MDSGFGFVPRETSEQDEFFGLGVLAELFDACQCGCGDGSSELNERVEHGKCSAEISKARAVGERDRRGAVELGLKIGDKVGGAKEQDVVCSPGLQARIGGVKPLEHDFGSGGRSVSRRFGDGLRLGAESGE